MAKDLPYFKFYCSEWSDGDITLETLEVQGLFVNVCAYYWSKECNLSVDKLKKKFRNNIKQLEILEDSEIFKVKNGRVVINFLDEQLSERGKLSNQNSINAKKRWEKKSEDNATASIPHNENHAIKKREEEKREDKNEVITQNTKVLVDWKRLLNTFNEITGKNCRVVNTKTKNQLKARLKEGYTKEDIVHAIKTCFKEDYHVETNHKHLTLEFITRADKLDKYVNITEKKVTPTLKLK